MEDEGGDEEEEEVGKEESGSLVRKGEEVGRKENSGLRSNVIVWRKICTHTNTHSLDIGEGARMLTGILQML